MKNKIIMRRARELRPCFDWKNSIEIAKLTTKHKLEGSKVIPFIESKGYKVEEIITGYCPDDDFPEGYLIITNKDGVSTQAIKFCCTGFYIEYKKNRHRFMSLTNKFDKFRHGEEIDPTFEMFIYFSNGQLTVHRRFDEYHFEKGEYKQIGKGISYIAD